MTAAQIANEMHYTVLTVYEVETKVSYWPSVPDTMEDAVFEAETAGYIEQVKSHYRNKYRLTPKGRELLGLVE